MEKTTVMAYFSIHGDIFDPEDVTRILEITPTEKKIKGLIPISKKRPSVETSWKLSTMEENSFDINIQLKQLIGLLEPKKEVLIDIKRTMNVEFVFCFLVKIENGEKPAMYFNLDSINFMSYIGAEIDIDLYIYS